MVSFKAKPFKIGGSYGIILPKQYVDNGLIVVDKEIELTVEGEQ